MRVLPREHGERTVMTREVQWVIRLKIVDSNQKKIRIGSICTLVSTYIRRDTEESES